MKKTLTAFGSFAIVATLSAQTDVNAYVQDTGAVDFDRCMQLFAAGFSIVVVPLTWAVLSSLVRKGISAGKSAIQ